MAEEKIIIIYWDRLTIATTTVTLTIATTVINMPAVVVMEVMVLTVETFVAVTMVDMVVTAMMGVTIAILIYEIIPFDNSNRKNIFIINNQTTFSLTISGMKTITTMEATSNIQTTITTTPIGVMVVITNIVTKVGDTSTICIVNVHILMWNCILLKCTK